VFVPLETSLGRCGNKGGREATRTRVPDLRLNPLIFNRDGASRELDADRRPAIDTELIADEPREHCTRMNEF
jgi:hypothetical protein